MQWNRTGLFPDMVHLMEAHLNAGVEAYIGHSGLYDKYVIYRLCCALFATTVLGYITQKM